MITNSTIELSSVFSDLPDPRDPRRITYPLENILTIAVCATMAGADRWEDIEAFGEAKREIFLTFLDMSAGAPKHDVYRPVFNRMKPEAFQEIFLKWTRSILAKGMIGQIAVDGKCMRGSGSAADSKQSPLHMASACDLVRCFSMA